MRYKIVELNSGLVYVEERKTITERRPGGKSYEMWARVKAFDSWSAAKEWIAAQTVQPPDPRGVMREEIIDV